MSSVYRLPWESMWTDIVPNAVRQLRSFDLFKRAPIFILYSTYCAVKGIIEPESDAGNADKTRTCQSHCDENINEPGSKPDRLSNSSLWNRFYNTGTEDAYWCFQTQQFSPAAYDYIREWDGALLVVLVDVAYDEQSNQEIPDVAYDEDDEDASSDGFTRDGIHEHPSDGSKGPHTKMPAVTKIPAAVKALGGSRSFHTSSIRDTKGRVLGKLYTGISGATKNLVFLAVGSVDCDERRLAFEVSPYHLLLFSSSSSSNGELGSIRGVLKIPNGQRDTMLQSSSENSMHVVHRYASLQATNSLSRDDGRMNYCDDHLTAPRVITFREAFVDVITKLRDKRPHTLDASDYVEYCCGHFVSKLTKNNNVGFVVTLSPPSTSQHSRRSGRVAGTQGDANVGINSTNAASKVLDKDEASEKIEECLYVVWNDSASMEYFLHVNDRIHVVSNGPPFCLGSLRGLLARVRGSTCQNQFETDDIALFYSKKLQNVRKLDLQLDILRDQVDYCPPDFAAPVLSHKRTCGLDSGAQFKIQINSIATKKGRFTFPEVEYFGGLLQQIEAIVESDVLLNFPDLTLRDVKPEFHRFFFYDACYSASKVVSTDAEVDAVSNSALKHKKLLFDKCGGDPILGTPKVSRFFRFQRLVDFFVEGVPRDLSALVSIPAAGTFRFGRIWM